MAFYFHMVTLTGNNSWENRFVCDKQNIILEISLFIFQSVLLFKFSVQTAVEFFFFFYFGIWVYFYKE